MATRRVFAWSFAAQGVSSATTLMLTVFTARSLGASAVGQVAVALTTWFLAAGLVRSLVVDPLIARHRGPGDDAATRASLTVAIAAGVLIAVAAGSAGTRFGSSSVGVALLAVAPWLPVGVVSTALRAIAFRDGRVAVALVSDAAWLVAFAATLATWGAPSVERAVGTWGFGGLIATAVLAVATRQRPARVGAALTWFRIDGSKLGRWLVAEGIVFVGVTAALAVGLTVVVGAADFGGLRAVESIFSPLSLLAPALTAAAQPALARCVALGRHPRRFAVRVGAAAAGLTALYCTAFAVAPSPLAALFGASFDTYSSLLAPVAIGQVALAASLAGTLLLKAHGLGRELFLARLVTAVAASAGALGFASTHGIAGAAWSVAVTSLAHCVVVTSVAFRTDGRRDPNLAAATVSP